MPRSRALGWPLAAARASPSRPLRLRLRRQPRPSRRHRRRLKHHRSPPLTPPPRPAAEGIKAMRPKNPRGNLSGCQRALHPPRRRATTTVQRSRSAASSRSQTAPACSCETARQRRVAGAKSPCSVPGSRGAFSRPCRVNAAGPVAFDRRALDCRQGPFRAEDTAATDGAEPAGPRLRRAAVWLVVRGARALHSQASSPSSRLLNVAPLRRQARRLQALEIGVNRRLEHY